LQGWGAIAIPPVPVLKVSQVKAEVTFLHAIPPRLVSFVIKLLCNLQAEIITLCHAIVEIHVIFVTLDDLSVEVVFQVNFSATNVVWQASRQKSTPLTITLAYGSD
jgi:hypothetical protein